MKVSLLGVFRAEDFSSHRLFLLLFLSCFFLTNLSAQKAELIYSKSFGGKKLVNIEFCDSLGQDKGSNQIGYLTFNQSEKVFFYVSPSIGQTWKFSQKDIESKLKEIKLIQKEKIIDVSKVSLIADNSDIGSFILGFQKSQIDITQPFQIRIKDSSSPDFTISERLWPNYNEFTELIRNAKSAFGSGNLFSSFWSMSQLWKKPILANNLSSFSFYSSAKDSLNHLADLIASQSNAQINKDIKALKVEASDESFEKLQSSKTSLTKNINYVDSFFVANKSEFDTKAKSALLQNVRQTILNDGAAAEANYTKKILSIFEDKNYQDYQYKIYTELIMKLITSVGKIGAVTSFDSIPLSEIKKYSALNNEINDVKWGSNFLAVCHLLNLNIKNKRYIFNEAAINKFTANKANEPQPYSLLFKAFNALIQKDKNQYLELVYQSMNIISDKQLLSNLDIYNSLVITNATDDYFWELVQKGFVAQQNPSTLKDAKEYFEKAEKLNNSNELLCLLMANTYMKLKDTSPAEIYFNRANLINPKFISSKLYQIEFLIDDKDYTTAMTYINDALDKDPNWYFYFKKASILQLTKKYEEAKAILITNCLTLNPWDYDEYLLLGDIYTNLSDLKNARENYMKAGNIKPKDEGYKKKMEALKQMIAK